MRPLGKFRGGLDPWPPRLEELRGWYTAKNTCLASLGWRAGRQR